MNDSAGDIQLFNAFRKGDDTAFAALYQRYAPVLVEYAAKRLTSLDEARDLIQDLFVYVWERRNEVEINQSVKAYLFLGLNRRIINHYRKDTYRSRYADQLKTMEEHFFFGPDAYVEAKEMQRIVSDTLDDMPRKVKEIYLLSREEHLSNTQIAERLGISEQTVKNQLSTAVTMLRKRLKLIGIVVGGLFFWV